MSESSDQPKEVGPNPTFCERHSDRDLAVSCRYPESTPSVCHGCGGIVPNVPPRGDLPKGPISVRFCSGACSNEWIAEHPRYFARSAGPM